MSCHPFRWLWGLIPIAMLGWMAMHLEHRRIERDLEQRSLAALAAGGHDWASVAFDGREGLLVGYPATEQQGRAAEALVRRVWGVHTLVARFRVMDIEDVPLSPARPVTAPPDQLVDAAAAHETIADVGRLVLLRPSPFTQEARVGEQRPAETLRLYEVAAPAAAQQPEPALSTDAPAAPVMAAADPSAPAAAPAATPPAVSSPAETTAAVPAVPPVPEAPLPPPPLPTRKPPQLAQFIPPLPVPARRFVTAALPEGNTGEDARCIEAARLAAVAVEVHFAHGRAELDGTGKGLLDSLAARLADCPRTVLRIAGHADSTGRPRSNLALSRRRARAVTRYLSHKGIDGSRLLAIGYGQTRPTAPNDTPENRARNRRIEVGVTPVKAPVPPLPVRK